MKVHFYFLFICIFHFSKVSAQTPNPCMDGDHEWASCFEDELLDAAGQPVWVAVNNVNCVGSTGTLTSLSDLITDGYVVDPSISASTPQSLIIFGTLVIDVDYHFASSNLFFENENNVGISNRIDVATGKKLTIDDTYISSCGFAWGGIRVKLGATLEIINNSLLSRASRAVHVTNNAHIKIEDSYFRSNTTSIYINNVQNATYQINRNKFEGVARAIPDIPNGTGDNFGITAVDSDPVSIGDDNHFLSFREIGLGVEDTELSIGSRNIFENCLYGLAIQNEINPNAFYEITRNRFINNYFGLSAFGVNAKIEDNHVEIEKINHFHPNVARGIIGLSDNNTIDIIDNQINRTGYLDQVFNCIESRGDGGQVNIYDNQINQEGRGTSIYANSTDQVSNSIHHNVITHQEVFDDNAGILFRQVSGVNEAYENTITSKTEDAYSSFKAIFIDKSDNVAVFDNNLEAMVNQLFSSPPPFDFSTDENKIAGIELLASNNCRIECNEIENFQYAIRFIGDCTPSTVRYNTMNESGVGIMVHLISSFGSIVNDANRFTGTFTYAEAVCRGDLTQNVFEVGHDVYDFYPNPHEPAGWVQLNGIVEIFECPPGPGGQLRKKATFDFNPTITPNPVTDDFRISGIDQSTTIKIYSTQGRLVFSKTISGSEEEINISNLTAGMYIAQITNAKQSASLRIIKH